MASGSVRQASFEKKIGGLELLSASGHTLLEYPRGKPLEADLLKEHPHVGAACALLLLAYRVPVEVIFRCNRYKEPVCSLKTTIASKLVIRDAVILIQQYVYV